MHDIKIETYSMLDLRGERGAPTVAPAARSDLGVVTQCCKWIGRHPVKAIFGVTVTVGLAAAGAYGGHELLSAGVGTTLVALTLANRSMTTVPSPSTHSPITRLPDIFATSLPDIFGPGGPDIFTNTNGGGGVKINPGDTQCTEIQVNRKGDSRTVKLSVNTSFDRETPDTSYVLISPDGRSTSLSFFASSSTDDETRVFLVDSKGDSFGKWKLEVSPGITDSGGWLNWWQLEFIG